MSCATAFSIEKDLGRCDLSLLLPQQQQVLRCAVASAAAGVVLGVFVNHFSEFSGKLAIQIAGEDFQLQQPTTKTAALQHWGYAWARMREQKGVGRSPAR